MVRNHRAAMESGHKARRVVGFESELPPPWDEIEWSLGAEADVSEALKTELSEARASFSPDWFC